MDSDDDDVPPWLRGRYEEEEEEEEEEELTTNSDGGEEEEAEEGREVHGGLLRDGDDSGDQPVGEDDEDSGSDGDEYDEAALRKAYHSKGGDANDGLDESDVAWVKRLEEWMACFTAASIKWSRVDTLGKQRYGLEVTMKADVEVRDARRRKKTVDLAKLREAIDLARLLVVVKPAVMVSVIKTLQGWGDALTCSEHEDEHQALLRGVPVDFRVMLRHSTLETLEMDTRLAQHFFHDLDQTPSTDENFVLAWKELELLLLRKYSRDEYSHLRVVGTPVNVVVSIDSVERLGTPEPKMEQFLSGVLRFVERLHQHQQQRVQATEEWTLGGEHLALRVDKIELTLHTVCITPRIQCLLKSIMGTGIPVECLSVKFCPRHIVDHPSMLQAFVDTLALSSIDIKTAKATCVESTDADSQDHTKLIRKIIDITTSVDRLDWFCLSGLLELYASRLNREAIWRGLFEVVLSQTSPIEDLALMFDCLLTAEDAELVTMCAARWRRSNPGRNLCLRRLQFVGDGGESAALLALLAAFDDVQHLIIECNSTRRRRLPHNTLVHALRYPSLRRLTLESVAIESMDVFNTTIADPRSPHRLVLEELDLSNVTIADNDSLRRFVDNLVPTSDDLHSLATSLRWLGIDLPHSEGFFDDDMAAALNHMLLQNSALSYVQFVGDENDPSLLKHRPPFLVHNWRHVRASPDPRRSDIIKARHWAFLSVLGEHTDLNGSARALGSMDLHIVRLIFDFSAPHAYRHVEVGESLLEFSDSDSDWDDEL